MSQKDSLKQVASLNDCVIVVIDVQNDFCAAGGALHRLGSSLESIAEMLPTLAQFLDEVRRLGGKIIFTQHRYDPAQMSPTMVKRDRLLFEHDRQLVGDGGFPVPGSWGEEFYALIQPKPNEPVVVKHRYNTFSSPKFTELLNQYKTKTLILTGLLTNVCVETTARATDATDYYLIVVEDCVASDSPELHRLSLTNLRRYFGWVYRSDELLALWTNSND